MNRIFCGLLLMSALIGCSGKPVSGDSSIARKFHPTKDVYLDELVDSDQPENCELMIRQHDKNGAVLFTFKTGSTFSRAIRIGDLIYVSAIDTQDTNGNLSLWRIDLSRGEVSQTGIKLFNDFAFSNDGQWICYTYNAHPLELPAYPGVKSYFPVVCLEKIDRHEKYIFDELNQMKIRPNFAELKEENGGFSVSYFQDSPKPLRVGRIDIVAHDFQWQ